MTLAIVIVAAVTSILITGLIVGGISVRPTTQCLFDSTVVYTLEGRFQGEKCSGKPENVYVTYGSVTDHLNGTRVCNGHVKLLQDVIDQLVREA